MSTSSSRMTSKSSSSSEMMSLNSIDRSKNLLISAVIARSEARTSSTEYPVLNPIPSMIAMLEGSATATIIFDPTRLIGRARCFWTISSGRRRTTSGLISYFERSTTGRLNWRPRKARSSSSLMKPAFTRTVPIRSCVFSWVSRAPRSWSAVIRFPFRSISPILLASTDMFTPAFGTTCLTHEFIIISKPLPPTSGTFPPGHPARSKGRNSARPDMPASGALPPS